MLASVGAAAGLSLVKVKLEEVRTVSIAPASAVSVEASEPRNILIVGTDSGENLDEGDPINNDRDDVKRADVIMILRVDPTEGTAQVLSIPRDSRVEISPTGYEDRINAALNGVDGPKNLTDTIEHNFGISIDNYVEVDFASFQELVEQLDGVPTYFAAPVRDKKSGLLIEEAGCHLLSPTQALAYARSRAFQYQDGDRWRYDQTGDLGRISRQQDFLKRAIRRASDQGLRNPGTALGVVNAAVDAVVLDETLTVGNILDLMEVFRRFNPDELGTEQIPTVSDPIDGVAYQEVVWDDAIELLEPFWGIELGEDLENSSIIVNVEGPSSEDEMVGLVAINLAQKDFDANTTSSRYQQPETTITHGLHGFQSALRLATYIDGPVELVYDEDIVGPRVVLAVGEDFRGILEEPVAVDSLPPDVLAPPESLTVEMESRATTTVPAESDSGAEPDQVEESTTSEPPVDEELAFLAESEEDGAPPGIVPTDPEQAALCH